MYNCPYCNKSLKHKRSLDRHVEQFHQAADIEATPPEPENGRPIVPPAPITPPELAHSAPVKPEPLEIKAPEPKDEYYCVDCGHKGLQHGMPACPGCGAGLVWEGIK